jgi:acetyl esterase/lipase
MYLMKNCFFYFKAGILRMNFKATFFLLVLLMFLNNSYGQTTIQLYKEIPNSKTDLSYKEKADTGTDGVIRISKVSIPQITIFQPENTNKKSSAVIICPGGGYSILAYNLEGTDVAKILNSWGVTAVVLKYRLPSDAIMKDKSIGPLQDAQSALKYVRENAEKLNIDPGKIGIMGFSAGGHLASTASTHFDRSYIANPSHTSLRPDFSILAYPVISFNDSIGHMGSRENLIGRNPSKQLIQSFSNQLQVTGNTPSTFLVLASDDKTVKPQNSIDYYEALLKNHVPVEMHIYENGGHGFGTKKDDWMQILKNWMHRNHLL